MLVKYRGKGEVLFLDSLFMMDLNVSCDPVINNNSITSTRYLSQGERHTSWFLQVGHILVLEVRERFNFKSHLDSLFLL